jgi:hypothetical protein
VSFSFERVRIAVRWSKTARLTSGSSEIAFGNGVTGRQRIGAAGIGRIERRAPVVSEAQSRIRRNAAMSLGAVDT